MIRPDFIQQAKRLLRDEYEAFAAALEAEPTVSIRINPRKTGAISLPDLLQEEITPSGEIPWCNTGYYLPRRPFFTHDPLIHAGAYYVQEASSMFLEQAIRAILTDPDISTNGITALDLCAAPGGKSTHLLALLPDDSLLVCNEIIRSRSQTLAENIAKWGYANTIITQSDPQAFGRIPHFFDVIVADLPCSGEGMFRKNRDARNEWSKEQVTFCASRQRRIIRDVWQALKPGGYLIYSTCTFNTEENEDNVAMLSAELGADVIDIPIKPEWNISGARGNTLPAYRFFPHRTRGEGFFLTILRKLPWLPVSGSKNLPSVGRLRIQNSVPSHIKNVLSNPEKFIFQNTKPKTKANEKRGTIYETINAIPKIHESAFMNLSEQLNIISAGVMLGELKGSDFVPSASLALSTELNIHAFPVAELSREQAIHYLKKELITLPPDTTKGHLLVTYRNIPLGFVKNTGQRANNLYPLEWRIRK